MSKKEGSYGFSSIHDLAKAIVDQIPEDHPSILKAELLQGGSKFKQLIDC